MDCLRVGLFPVSFGEVVDGLGDSVGGGVGGSFVGVGRDDDESGVRVAGVTGVSTRCSFGGVGGGGANGADSGVCCGVGGGVDGLSNGVVGGGRGRFARIEKDDDEEGGCVAGVFGTGGLCSFGVVVLGGVAATV